MVELAFQWLNQVMEEIEKKSEIEKIVNKWIKYFRQSNDCTED